MMAFRQLPVPTGLVAVAAVVVVNAVRRRESVVEIRVKHVRRAALNLDPSEGFVPAAPRPPAETVKLAAGRLFHTVPAGTVPIHAGNAGKQHHFFQVIGEGELHQAGFRFIHRQERLGEHGGKVHLPVLRPAGHPAVAQDFGSLQGQPVLRGLAPGADAMPRIDPDEPGSRPRECVPVYTGVGRSGQLRRDALGELDFVVTRFSHLVLV